MNTQEAKQLAAKYIGANGKYNPRASEALRAAYKEKREQTPPSRTYWETVFPKRALFS